MKIDIKQIKEQLEKYYGLKNTECKLLNTLANYALEVTSPSSRYALKIYNPASRSPEEVRWEIDLTLHLIEHGAPVAKPAKGRNNEHLQSFVIDGQELTAVLFEWAPGEKPKPDLSTYELIGRSAALIHQAADSFKTRIDHV